MEQKKIVNRLKELIKQYEKIMMAEEVLPALPEIKVGILETMELEIQTLKFIIDSE